MKDEEIINILKEENEEFRKLVEEHRRLDRYLDEMNKKRYLTSDEEIEKKKLQKKKLYYKDRIAEMIREYRKKRAV